MNDPDLSDLMKAAAERQLAVAALQQKYGVSPEQLVGAYGQSIGVAGVKP